jgi:hypothetical protein
MDLYIYYRVRNTEAAQFCAKVLAMQHNLARAHKIGTALKRRPDEKDGMQTWMEVYLGVADDFAVRLHEAVAENQLSSWIDGERHTEQFVDVSLCV